MKMNEWNTTFGGQVYIERLEGDALYLRQPTHFKTIPDTVKRRELESDRSIIQTVASLIITSDTKHTLQWTVHFDHHE